VASSLVSKPKLRVLDLHGNSLSGSLPDMINAESISLEYLSLQNNYFAGPVPQSINQLSHLKYLDVSSNALSGNLPSTMQFLTKLEYLFVANNTGFQPGPVPDFLRAMTLLEEVSLKATSQTGTIPDWIGDLTLLKLLDVDMNMLTGTLPASIGSLDSLRYLLINRNELNGTITADISQLSHLEVFVLDNNSITGNAPGGVLCNMPRIDVLIADCGGTMGSQPKVDCPCCSLCCEDSNATCNDVWWLSSYDPLYEVNFTRPGFIFSQDVIYRPAKTRKS
jgi:Leucine-rich repeat (LRR) protein